MTDAQILEEIASRWIELEGDSEGFLWNWRDIYELLKEKENK